MLRSEVLSQTKVLKRNFLIMKFLPSTLLLCKTRIAFLPGVSQLTTKLTFPKNVLKKLFMKVSYKAVDRIWQRKSLPIGRGYTEVTCLLAMFISLATTHFLPSLLFISRAFSSASHSFLNNTASSLRGALSDVFLQHQERMSLQLNCPQSPCGPIVQQRAWKKKVEKAHPTVMTNIRKWPICK